VKAHLDEDRCVLIKDITEPIIKEFLRNMTLIYKIAISSVIGLGNEQTKYSSTYWI
jgi:hypothetical protein